MSHDTILAPSCLSRLFRTSRFNAFARDNSPSVSTTTSAFAQISAAGLVIASAGFGAYYAFTTGSHHGLTLACLMTLMAVALELAKPLSLAAAFSAFRSFSLVRGAALAILAVVAIAYSLTAELSLMATSRGDLVANREAAMKLSTSAEQDQERTLARYKRASAELASMPIGRPAQELQAEIDGLMLRPGVEGCVTINGKVTRDICPKVAALRIEKAKADRRAELEQILAGPPPAAVGSNAGQQAINKADPAASALSAYLNVLGFAIAPAVLSEWLVLVGVLALEIGSAFAALLVQAFAPPKRVDATQARANRKEEAVEQPQSKQVVQVVQADKQGASKGQPLVVEQVKNAILNQLESMGGKASSSERGLAKQIGAKRQTVRRAMNSLVLAGVVAMEATRNGTLIRVIT